MFHTNAIGLISHYMLHFWVALSKNHWGSVDSRFGHRNARQKCRIKIEEHWFGAWGCLALFCSKLPSFHPRERKCLEDLRWCSWCNVIWVYPGAPWGLQNVDMVETLVMGWTGRIWCMWHPYFQQDLRKGDVGMLWRHASTDSTDFKSMLFVLTK